MFEELYAPLPDKAAYLERIGMKDEALPLNAETLHRLMYAHLTHVPFENLDVFEKHITPDLAVEALFDKIVTRRRGGYCFEQNGLFCALLEALGFTCYPVIGRVIRGPGYIPNPSHRGTVVTLPEGKYYCDVGFGGEASAYPLALSGEKSPDGFYIGYEGPNCVIYHEKKDGGEERTIMFSENPAYAVDFIPQNFHMAQWEGSLFRMMPVLNIRTEDGACAIMGQDLRIHKNGVLTEKKLETHEEFLAALREYFGIVLEA